MIHVSATVVYVEEKFHVDIETRMQTLPSLPSVRVNSFRFECASEAHARRIAREVNTPKA